MKSVQIHMDVRYSKSVKAMKQFKKDYALGLDYMENVRGLPQFSSKYKVLTWYAWHCWQVEVVEDIENKEEVKEQLRAISEFANFLYQQ